MCSHALNLLLALRWHAASDPQPAASLSTWLFEKGSMTARLEKYYKRIAVHCIRENFVSSAEVAPEICYLPRESRYWLREIILKGDDIPLLAARTVIPESTLAGPNRQLQQLGSQPLGHTLFTMAPQRDLHQLGTVATLWGRRTRWQLTDKPLLLTELFLSDAPLYVSNQPKARR